MRRSRLASLVLICGLVGVMIISLGTAPAVGQDDGDDLLSTDELLKEIRSLMTEIGSLRASLAAADLKCNEATRELEEMRQFIADHHELGRDFESYRAIKAIAEQEAKQREAEARRQRYEQERADRRARYEQAKAERAQRNAARDEEARYARAGFNGVGLDVYVSNMGYFYSTTDTQRQELTYHPLVGFDYVPVTDTEIDYSTMKFSGSVINANADVRNIGIAITFFDERGNQIGAETVQINNARAKVPYPFSAEIDMASNRAFASSSIYVLYADPIE